MNLSNSMITTKATPTDEVEHFLMVQPKINSIQKSIIAIMNQVILYDHFPYLLITLLLVYVTEKIREQS